MTWTPMRRTQLLEPFRIGPYYRTLSSKKYNFSYLYVNTVSLCLLLLKYSMFKSVFSPIRHTDNN